MDRQEGTERGDPVLPPSGDDAVAEAPELLQPAGPTDADEGLARDASAGAPVVPGSRSDSAPMLFDQEKPVLRPEGMPPLALGLALDGAVPFELVFAGGEGGLLQTGAVDVGEDEAGAVDVGEDEAGQREGGAVLGSDTTGGASGNVTASGVGEAPGAGTAPSSEILRGAAFTTARPVALDGWTGSGGEDVALDEGGVAASVATTSAPATEVPAPRRGLAGRVRHALRRGATSAPLAPEPAEGGGGEQEAASRAPSPEGSAPEEPRPEDLPLVGAPSPVAPAAGLPGGGSLARPERARAAQGSPASELGRRVATGVAFGVVAIAAFLGGPVSSLALVMVVIVLALAEAYAVLRRSGYRPATLVGLAVTLVMIPAAYHFGTAALPVAWVVALAASFTWFLGDGRRQRATANLAVTILAFGWVGVFGAYAAALLDPTTFPHRHGVADLSGVVLLTIGYDVGAYLVGRQVGRHALLRSVSPNKTVEGLVGGVLGAIVAAVVLAHVHPWTLLHAVVVAVVVMVVAPLGDLAESLLKRDLQVKDMGTLLPGHGGVLDRIDAILFVLPVAYYVLEILHVH